MSIRPTKKRQAILDLLTTHQGALTAAEIHITLPTIDLATVYRTLDLYTQAGTVKKLYLGEDEARYEYQDVPHHHAICTQCERVIHFKAPDEKIKKLLGIETFDVTELEVTVRGVCDSAHNHS